MAKKQFGASGLNSLNSAIDSINDAVEQYATPTPAPAAPVTDTTYGAAEKSLIPGKKEKTTVGINIEIPKEDYRRLQNMRINLDGIPLRTLALQLVLQGIDRYERGL